MLRSPIQAKHLCGGAASYIHDGLEHVERAQTSVLPVPSPKENDRRDNTEKKGKAKRESMHMQLQFRTAT